MLLRFLSLLFLPGKRGKRKDCGVASGVGGTHWPWQHESFHASFLHFITSLGECEGLEGEALSLWDRGGGVAYSIFSTLTELSPRLVDRLGACVKNHSTRQGVRPPRERTSSVERLNAPFRHNKVGGRGNDGDKTKFTYRFCILSLNMTNVSHV